MKITLKRLDDAFHMQATNEEGLTVESDASLAIGGHQLAMRPMQLVLVALGSCSSIDVIELLRKQRQPLDHIEIDVDAERADAVPAVFTKIHIHYRLYGDVNPAKAERACRLSVEKLCSVSKMLEKTAEITWDFEILAGRDAARG